MSKPPSQFETAKPVTVKMSLIAVENDGQRIQFEDKGKSSLALIASETEVTVGGGKSETGALKVGMTCEVTYFGDRGQAKSVTCE